MRIALLLLVALAAAPTSAAERRLYLASFSRLRVEGPIRVAVTTGRPPAGHVTADPRQLDAVEVRQDGETVTVRPADAAQSQAAGAAPIAVTLVTPSLVAASVIGAGEVTVTAMKGAKIDLSVAGAGAITVAAADGADVDATSIGDGRLTLAGHATRARLIVNGVGAIKAAALQAAELTVRLDGPGTIDARAGLTASVSNTGLGQVTVAGNPKCTVRGAGISCGSGLAR